MKQTIDGISDAGADYIIDKLESAGFEGYYVGGCVRNFLLGLPIKDYDITTSASPEIVMELFGDRVIVDSGIRHGTVRVLLNGRVYEVTSFRKEGKYSDCRHPDKVYFCNDLGEDLKRRDFTCNAMAFSKKQGIIDNFNGVYDTRNHILKAVGVASTRFKEDALRILRGLRFCSEFGFSTEERTSRAMHSNKELLENISRERIYSELKKTFDGKYVHDALKDFGDVLEVALKDKSGRMTENVELYNKALLAAERSDSGYLISFPVLLYVLYEGNLSEAIRVLNDLKCENSLRKRTILFFECASFLRNCFTLDKNDTITDYSANENERQAVFDYPAKKILIMSGEFKEEFFVFLDAVYFGTASAVAVKAFIDKCRFIVSSGEYTDMSLLAITGSDLAPLGFRGSEIGKALDFALDEIIRGRLKNEKNAIIEKLLQKRAEISD